MNRSRFVPTITVVCACVDPHIGLIFRSVLLSQPLCGRYNGLDRVDRGVTLALTFYLDTEMTLLIRKCAHDQHQAGIVVTGGVGVSLTHDVEDESTWTPPSKFTMVNAREVYYVQ